MAEFAPLKAADYLADEETIAEVLTVALEDPNPVIFWSLLVILRVRVA